MNEWPLIIFTILAQMSVGAFVMLELVHLYVSRKAGEAEADRFTDRALWAIIVTLGLGLLASILHLGNPLGAPRAITNLATSWLSREIAFSAAFFTLAAVFVFLQWFKKGSAMVRNVVAVVASLAGVGLVVSMSVAYMLPSQPAWNTPATLIRFFATALLLGAVALCVAFYVNYLINKRQDPACENCQADVLRDVMGKLSIVALVMLGVEFIVIPASLAALTAQGGAAAISAALVGSTYRAMFVIQMLLAFLGVGVCGVALLLNARSTTVSRLGALAVSAFVLVLAAEVVGRFLFYATRVSLGL
ncbi:MAG: dimethyl sulfoxide reductase anchor subunit [Chloroflexi bacterium]|nr:dimethyl sulfoxide reductase anchor subunit [Chloroflexota bacterium]